MKIDYPKLDGAACATVDPEAFYPPEGAVARETARAVRVCLGCPVRAECLAWALDNRELFGIWGGLTVKQRTELRRERRMAS